MENLIEIVNKFVADKKVERKQLMISKGFIDPSVEYTDSLWEEFKDFRLKQWISANSAS